MVPPVIVPVAVIIVKAVKESLVASTPEVLPEKDVFAAAPWKKVFLLRKGFCKVK
jgi:hypothetical protein